MSAMPAIGETQRLLYEERFEEIFSVFQNWRMDSFIRYLEATRKKGRILPFVRGLRLSAQLVYAIREHLTGNLKASWGHLVDNTGRYVSCECDVIIHKPGHYRRWNGTNEPIMDFKFIPQENAIVVISCKSYLRTNDIDTEYCQQMSPFVNKIWLFAECCGPRSADNIQSTALSLGYEKFWYLYTWSKKSDPTPNKMGWVEFIGEIRKLA